jgi:hypothetical protein
MEVTRLTAAALVLLRRVAELLPPVQAGALRDCMEAVERVTGVRLDEV